MSETMTLIQPEQPQDFEPIRNLLIEAFGGTVEADLVERIRRSPQYRPELTLVYRNNGSIVGHIMLSECDIVAQDGTAAMVLALAPVAVLPAYQKKGIGGELIREAIRLTVP